MLCTCYNPEYIYRQVFDTVIKIFFVFSDVLFQSLLPCNIIKFNPTRLEHIPPLLLYSIGRLSGITNEVFSFYKIK